MSYCLASVLSVGDLLKRGTTPADSFHRGNFCRRCRSIQPSGFLARVSVSYPLADPRDRILAASRDRLLALPRGSQFEALARRHSWPAAALFSFFFWLLLLIIWCAPEQSGFSLAVLAVVAVSFPYLIWRAGYMLLSGQRGRAEGSRFGDHLFYIWPVWDGTNTPPGKGHDNLIRAEAQTPEAYARAILGGIKLLLLVALWKIVIQVMGAVVYGDPKSSLTPLLKGFYLGIPRLKQILGSDASTPLFVMWVGLYLELVWETLSLAAKGHVWIGALRLFGFNVFRNTYKPLLAETVVDFWNRYYYYFKELMMEFFFFPAYVRYFRKQPGLRMITAVFAAAFVGNMYYHLLQAKDPLIAGNADRLWAILGARLVYCFLLASGIAISMLRQQKLRGNPNAATTRAGGFSRVKRIACVWTFFAVINFWNAPANLTIAERGRLFLSLFGL